MKNPASSKRMYTCCIICSAWNHVCIQASSSRQFPEIKVHLWNYIRENKFIPKVTYIWFSGTMFWNFYLCFCYYLECNLWLNLHNSPLLVTNFYQVTISEDWFEVAKKYMPLIWNRHWNIMKIFSLKKKQRLKKFFLL